MDDASIVGIVIIVCGAAALFALWHAVQDVRAIDPGQHRRKRRRAFSHDDWQSVALDYVYGKVLRTYDSFWGGTVEQCDRAIERINNLRAEYKDLQPPKLRKEIMDWLDFYEKRAKDDRADVVSQKHRKQMDAYDLERKERDRRANALRRQLATRS
jgi:hypothetical protein